MKVRKIAQLLAGLVCGTVVLLLDRSGEQAVHWKIVATGQTEHEVKFWVKASEKPSQTLRALLSDPGCALHHIELGRLDRNRHADGAELKIECEAPVTLPVMVKIKYLLKRRKMLPDLLLTARVKSVYLWESPSSPTGATQYYVMHPRSLGRRVTYHADIAKARQEAFETIGGIMDDAHLPFVCHLSQPGPTYAFGGQLQSDSGLIVQVNVGNR
jgi:hypothetical protein